MFHSMYGFQSVPILKPADPIGRNPAPEDLLHIVIDLLSSLGRQTFGVHVVLQHEFRPYAEVDDARIETIRPIVVDNLDIRCIFLALASHHDEGMDPSSRSVVELPGSVNGGPLAVRSVHLRRRFCMKVSREPYACSR